MRHPAHVEYLQKNWELVSFSEYALELRDIDGELAYPVERIIDRRVRSGEVELFVKFCGRPNSWNEWISIAHVPKALAVAHLEESPLPVDRITETVVRDGRTLYRLKFVNVRAEYLNQFATEEELLEAECGHLLEEFKRREARKQEIRNRRSSTESRRRSTRRRTRRN